MRGFWAKVAAILRSMPSFAMRLVERAGRKVWELIAVPAAPMAEAADVVPDTTPAKTEDYASVRELAKSMAAGLALDADTLKGVPEKTVKWLEALDRNGLCRVALAKDEVLAGHFRGREPMKGLVPYDDQAIKEVSAVKDEPRPRDRKPTLRDLYEQHGVSLAA